jgi:hypothetical protein
MTVFEPSPASDATYDTHPPDDVLRALDQEIARNEDKFTILGYRYGVLSLSLYYFTASRYFRSEEHFRKGEDRLAKVFGLLNDGYVSARLYKEIAEVGEFLEYCRRMDLYTEDTNEILDDFDSLLHERMQEDLAQKNFDPATGALAYGYYFLSRLPSTNKVEPILRELAIALQRLSFEDENGVYWKSKLKGDDSVYLGITHGSAAVITFLVQLTRKGVVLGMDGLIRKAALYIKNSELTNKAIIYPVVKGEPLDKPQYSNNWCYGDIGTAYGLFEAARHLNDEALYHHCLEVFRQIVQRPDGPPYLIAGKGLLYGYAGIALVCSHLHELTGCGFFSDAYTHMAMRVRGSYNPDDEFMGYRGYWNQELPVTNYSFFEGMIGISLFLMADSRPELQQSLKPLFNLY